MVVPVLLRHRTRPGRVRPAPARLRQAHLADRVAQVGLRRRHLRSQRRRIRQPRSCADRDPQLPLATGPGRRRGRPCRAGGAARAGAGDRRADHHPRRRRQRRPSSGPELLCPEVLRYLFPPDHRGRHRAQPSPGSPGGVRQRRHRGRRLLTSTPPHQGAVMPPATTDHAPLTVVLVHGAFADASSWTGVIERLQAAGIQVAAPPNPLRGISTDSAYIASFLNQIPGPIVAVGHSYGGAVISNAATNADNVVGLVFVAAFAPDEGERLGEVESGSKDSVLMSALVPLQYPTGQGSETAVEFAIDPAKFHDAFAADLPPAQTAVMAATQRPIAELAFPEPSGPPAWKSSPAWAVVATGDKAAGTDVIRSMAKRAGATITELEGSHVIMVSQPAAVADVIQTAAAAVDRTAVAAGG